MTSEKACKKCKKIVEGKQCPVCGSEDLTPHWRGIIYIVDPEKSELAKKLKIGTPGKYALKVR